MFSALTFSLLAAVFYTIAAVWVILYLLGKTEAQSWLVRLLGFTGWGFHAGALLFSLNLHSYSYASFTETFSLVNWLICGLILFLSLLKPSLNLAGFIFPLVAAGLVWGQLYPGHTLALHTQKGLVLHIVISLAAYSFFALAAVQAVLFGLQNSRLKKHKFKGLVRALPPLQTMETLLFEFIYLGQILLSLGIFSGFVFLNNLFAPGLLHKTLLSIAAWFMFGGLILGHKLLGWRGQTAVKLTLGGSGLLLLAFFGSKFVLQFVLAA